MGYVIREINILRNNQKEMLEIKTISTEIKGAFDGLISKLDTAEERFSALDDI